MSTDPLNVYSRREIAEGAKHFRQVADHMPLSTKIARKAEKREACAALARAEDAEDAANIAQLDRLAGEAQFRGVMAPARRVQGYDVPTTTPPAARTYTAADVEGLRARIAADEGKTR